MVAPRRATPPPPTPPPPSPPTARAGGPRWLRGPWRVAIAVVGIAAIAFGVIEIVSHARSETTTTTTRTGLAKAAFIRRADAICALLNPEIEADYRIALADSNDGEIVGARTEIARMQLAANRLIARIQALGPPAQGAQTVAMLLAEYQQLVDDAIVNSPESNAAAIALQTQIAAQASQYGFRVCGVS